MSQDSKSTDAAARRKLDVIFFIGGEWHGQYHRRGLVQEVAKHSQVDRLFVIEIFADFFHSIFKKPYRFRNAIKSLFATQRENGKIYSYTPLILIHMVFGIKIPVIRHLNVWMFNRSMKRLMKREGIHRKTMVWVYRPEFVDYIDFTKEKLLIYDCYDEHQIDIHGKKRKHMDKWEEALMKRCDYIFTTSTKLLDKVRKCNSNCYFIPNAANVEILQRAYMENLDIPVDLLEITPPRIGYIGRFRNWIDFELLEHLFQKNIDKSFIFVGGWTRNVKNIVEKFRQRSNVFFLGDKAFEEIPRYLKFFDVVMIPNKVNKFNQNVIPYKLFEYMAAGKKIITTSTSKDLSKYYGNYVEVADTKEEFSKKISMLLNDDNFESSKVFAFGKNQSWRNRVEEMFSIINNGSSY